MKIEIWRGREIHFYEIDGDWWALLQDICDAFDLNCDLMVQHLPREMVRMEKVDKNDPLGIPYPWVNELGIYELLLSSIKADARKFRLWSGAVMQKLRRSVGLNAYEVLKMMEPEVQDEIDQILDTLYWDEETGKIMRSVTVAGGDVDQVEFC